MKGKNTFKLLIRSVLNSWRHGQVACDQPQDTSAICNSFPVLMSGKLSIMVVSTFLVLLSVSVFEELRSDEDRTVLTRHLRRTRECAWPKRRGGGVEAARGRGLRGLDSGSDGDRFV